MSGMHPLLILAFLLGDLCIVEGIFCPLRVRLDQLLATTARCAPAYFLKSSLSVSGTVDSRPPVSHGGRRLMLHPCFASSLRLAQGAGLRKLVAAARKSVQALQKPVPRLLHLAVQPHADQQQVKSTLASGRN